MEYSRTVFPYFAQDNRLSFLAVRIFDLLVLLMEAKSKNE